VQTFGTISTARYSSDFNIARQEMRRFWFLFIDKKENFGKGSSIKDVRAEEGGHAKVDKGRNALNLVNLSTEQKWIGRGGGQKSGIFHGRLLWIAPKPVLGRAHV
jgi:hypothetical protein